MINNIEKVCAFSLSPECKDIKSTKRAHNLICRDCVKSINEENYSADFVSNINSEFKAYFFARSLCKYVDSCEFVSFNEMYFESLVFDRDDYIEIIPTKCFKEIHENCIESTYVLKQHIYEEVRNIPEDLFIHFLRGLFISLDGIQYYQSKTMVVDLGDINNELSTIIMKKSKYHCKQIQPGVLIWEGVNYVDMTWDMFNNYEWCENESYGLHLMYNKRCDTIPSLNFPSFNWKRTIKGAFPPSKSRFSDSGYDLHIMKLLKVKGSVHYYDTGIAVSPDSDHYFDMVGRSSISKTGWMIANNVGIIDSSYRGSIIVALIKIDPDAKELELPMRLVQLIPRKVIHMRDYEVEELDITERGSKGFGSSN